MKKEKVEAFVNDLKSYKYCKYKYLPELKSNIDNVFYMETGVSGVRADKVPTHPSEEAIAMHRLSLIEKREALEQVYNEKKRWVDYIEYILNNLPADINYAVKFIYINRGSYENAITRGNLAWSKGGLYKAIYRELGKQLEMCSLDKYIIMRLQEEG